jgi:hypothetical protein
LKATTSAGLSWLSLKFGLWSLLAYLSLGLALEALHGFKVGWYLDFETRRLMWGLAHAHGVLLSVLVIGFGMMISVWPDDDAPWRRIASGCLLAATVLLPCGFLLGGAFVHGGDPGVGVVLSPVGGVLLFVGVALTAVKLRPPAARVARRDR